MVNAKYRLKKNHKDDTETINTRLSQLEANIISSYTEDQPELNLKEWLKSIIGPTKDNTEKQHILMMSYLL
jgi:hypothetical protein